MPCRAWWAAPTLARGMPKNDGPGRNRAGEYPPALAATMPS